LVARRKAKDSGAGFWEFPGGKVEPGETREQALTREIQEELELPIRILELLESHEVVTPHDNLIQLSLYATQVESRHYKLNEHDDAKWVSWKDLSKVSFLKGNTRFFPAIENFFNKSKK
jgi:8-oxo-dGTP diphosphatase